MVQKIRKKLSKVKKGPQLKVNILGYKSLPNRKFFDNLRDFLYRVQTGLKNFGMKEKQKSTDRKFHYFHMTRGNGKFIVCFRKIDFLLKSRRKIQFV